MYSNLSKGLNCMGEPQARTAPPHPDPKNVLTSGNAPVGFAGLGRAPRAKARRRRWGEGILKTN
jgi:hypothetical protein